MLKEGIIVSVQGYSFATTQELAEHAVKGGAVAIRTDKPLEIDTPMIGLMKFKNKRFYITTSVQAIENLSFSTNYVAIDSRKGNKQLKELYEFCYLHSIDIVADIGTIKDVENLLEKELYPDYICTTFSFLHNNGRPDIDLIKQIKELTDIPVIAEGGYINKYDVISAYKAGAHNVCIGRDITKIYEKTVDYVEILRGLECS